jgi:hypothetical protein
MADLYDDVIDGALQMMAECLEDLANGENVLDAIEGADEFARYAADAILDDMGVI